MIRSLKSWQKALLGIGCGWLLLEALVPKPPLKEGISSSTAFTDRNGRLLRLTLSHDEKYRLWIPLSKISEEQIQTTLLREDRYFWLHPGFNPISLLRAAKITYLLKERKMGGSTLTMQLARIRYGLRTQSLHGKIRQIFIALAIEWHYSKREILEAYLNLVPCGGNIEGVGAASLIYFSKPVEKLKLPEILTLVAIPQNPSKRTVQREEETIQADPSLSSARRSIFRQLLKKYPEYTREESQIEMPVVMRTPSNLPFEAPHFVDSLLTHAQTSVVATTLDLGLQKFVERKIWNFIERNGRLGIRNAAAILIDFETMGIRACVGSADFFNEKIEGQVNGTQAKRSPGSALKPFVYALGMEQGLLHPMTMLKDAPSSFGGFNPENFEHDFVGPIKARDALMHSRNVPAIFVASRLKDPDLYAFLKDASIDISKEASYYGMALALGGLEVTMEELVKLYAMLANGGVLKDLIRYSGQKEGSSKRLLSKEVSYLTLDMLKDKPRPDQNFKRDWTANNLTVHWKTGTSFAFRDAWTIGVFGPYILAVWIGNFNGQGNPAFVGIRYAAPLFFEIIDAMQSQGVDLRSPRMEPLENLVLTDVCSVSGQEPNSFCPNRVTTYFIAGKSPIGACEIHRQILVDRATGLRVCAEDFPGAQAEIFEYWPSDLSKIFRLGGIPRRLPPPDHPSCASEAKAYRGLPSKILSPQKRITYHLRAESLSNERIPFSAVSDADTREIFWFVNKDFVGKSKGDEPFFWPPRVGRFVVRAVDDRGRSDALEVKIALIN